MSPELQPIGRVLIVLGLILLGVGLLFLYAPNLPWIGRLPGDILIRRERMTFYVPLASSLLVSVILSALLWVLGRFHR